MNALEEDDKEVDEEKGDEEELGEDVRYVNDDLEEREDEFAKACDKLLELEITGSEVRNRSLSWLDRTHM